MMKRTVWYRTTLLAGTALAIAGAQAEANELDSLKQQLAALQQKVTELEAQRVPYAAPETDSWITFRRGSEAVAGWRTSRVGDGTPVDRGFTIAISPAADLPAPVHEVTVSGYVKGDVIYDLDQDVGDYFSYSEIVDSSPGGHVRLHARQSRFRIQSRSQTAIGEVRSLIEGDFYADGPLGSTDFRLRHAWGEWDMTREWTFGAGQYWRNFMSLFTGINTVDFNGPAGLIGTSRVAQVRLAYHSGPSEFAISIEKPTGESEMGTVEILETTGTGTGTTTIETTLGVNDEIPDLAARWQYAAPGGHDFLVSGALRYFSTSRKLNLVGSDSAFGWVVQGAANINLADKAVLSASVIYGDGAGNYINGAGSAFWVDPATGEITTIEALGLFAGITLSMSDATSVNVGWGMVMPSTNNAVGAALDNGLVGGHFNKNVMSIHGNILWQPVRALRLGWEVMYGERKYYDLTDDGAVKKGDDIRTQFGAWFYF